jgi:hypothetical protein
MKICILSMQRVQNFGSLLQGYALKRIIESLGHEVAFIDIKPIPEDNELVITDRMIFIDEMEKYSKNRWLRYLSKIDRYIINRLKSRILLKKQHDIFEDFRINYLSIKETDNLKTYDICVIGSDEVFNCMSATAWGFTSQLFGNVEQASRVITYAASCGSTTYESLPPRVADRIRDAFSNISSFSVRDKNTQIFVESLMNNAVNIHLDPVCIGDFTQEISNESLTDMPEHFCIVYSYENRIYKKEEIDYIKRLCKKNNLEIVALGSPQMWINKYYTLTPFQLLKAFTMADFVYTDTFHGCIFASKFAKRFAVMTRPSNKNKLMDLILRLNVEEHLLSDIREIEQKYGIENRLAERKELIAREHVNTVDYLRDNL